MNARSQTVQRFTRPLAVAMVLAVTVGITVPRAFEGQTKAAAAAQKMDEEYTKKIVDSTPDKRILTELVDHMPLPVDPKVPSPLKVLGYIPGEGGKLTYSADVYKYLDALDAASARVTCWSIGKTEEGRDTRACAVADEATIRDLAKFKKITADLTDPRKTPETSPPSSSSRPASRSTGPRAASTPAKRAASRC